jgi:hypothetical protein
MIDGSIDNLKIIGLKEVVHPLQKSYVGYCAIAKKRNFLGRTFHSIGKWFK